MAITHVKVTYSVQPHTAQRVQELAAKWGVPKSEVIRRAIEKVPEQPLAQAQLDAMEALREIGRKAILSKTEAARFSNEVRKMRRNY